MKAWVIVLGLFVLLGLGIVFLLVGIPVGLVIFAYLSAPTDTTTTTMSATSIAATSTTFSSNTLTIVPTEGAECTEGEYCDVQVASATGGQEPYSYQSDSFATGAPPMGMIIDLNGHLTGTPKSAGVHRFGVCVADAIRDSECTQAAVTVNKKEIVDEAAAKIDSFTCKFKYKDTYGDKHYELSASGTATGPERSELQLVFNPGYFTKRSSACTDCETYCGSWGDSVMQSCTQSGSDTTVWEVFVPASQVLGDIRLETVDYRVTLHARIFMGGNLLAEETAYATCPR